MNSLPYRLFAKIKPGYLYYLSSFLLQRWSHSFFLCVWEIFENRLFSWPADKQNWKYYLCGVRVQRSIWTYGSLYIFTCTPCKDTNCDQLWPSLKQDALRWWPSTIPHVATGKMSIVTKIKELLSSMQPAWVNLHCARSRAWGQVRLNTALIDIGVQAELRLITTNIWELVTVHISDWDRPSKQLSCALTLHILRIWI
jgi:hypothetical protein